MKSVICMLTVTFFTFTMKGQAKIADRRLDSLIEAKIWRPVLFENLQNGKEPDWRDLQKDITAKYTAAAADRNVNKAQIYYFYQVNSPKFSAALVRFTEKYENKSDAPLMNKNARMVADTSEDESELQTAKTWINSALAKDPKNDTYKKTLALLTAKLAARS